ASDELARLARALDEGTRPLPAPPAGTDAAVTYLAADHAFARGAAAGTRLLPAIEAYRHALRRHPGFLDAPRARMNVVLAYRAMGFRTELAAEADALASSPGGGFAFGLLGDLLQEQDAAVDAQRAYERAAGHGPLGVCLATRGRASLAVAGGDVDGANRALADLPTVCPETLAADAETDQVRARVELAGGDARGALATLTSVEKVLGARATLLEDVAAADVAAGDAAAARATYERLADGSHGARAAAHAAVALARLDAAAGDVTSGLRRLGTLDGTAARAERRAFTTRALEDALGRGADRDAVTLLHEQGIAPTTLDPMTQLRLARSYRVLGLLAPAEALLDGLRGKPEVADGVAEERAAVALARDD